MEFTDKEPRVPAGGIASPDLGLLAANMSQLVHEFRELAHDHIELVTLEARYSINTLLRMVVIAIVTALVLVSAWLALLGSAALALIALGLSPVIAMSLLAVANLLLALAGWLRIRHLSHWLGWPATQRAIRPAAAAESRRDGK